MLKKKEALALLDKYKLDDKRIRHSRAVAAFAYKLAKRIHAKHPKLSLDPKRVRIAGLLHDIGRAKKGDHELQALKILRLEGQTDIARIVMHGSMYEIMKLRGTDDPTLLPRSLENKIVAYADARVHYKVVSLKDRVAEIMERRREDDEKVRAIRMAMPRYEALEKELQKLAGKIKGLKREASARK